jgi:Glutamine cyclotransferase
MATVIRAHSSKRYDQSLRPWEKEGNVSRAITLFFARLPPVSGSTDFPSVRDALTPIHSGNELEFVDGQIFANVWHRNGVAGISPQTGEVVGWSDLSGLLSPIYRLELEPVPNGIAYDPVRKRVLFAGNCGPASSKSGCLRNLSGKVCRVCSARSDVAKVRRWHASW